MVTCAQMPEPDADEALLAEALEGAGLDASLLAWDDPTVAWGRFDLAALRSTWNYHSSPDAFVAWLARVDAETRLLNPRAIVEANIHKGYLLALAARGVPVVPTALIERGRSIDVGSVLARRGWKRAVIKPAIGAGSYGARIVEPGELASANEHLAHLLETRDALVQPYLASVEDVGERAMVWVDGALTHSVRKSRRLSGEDESVTLADGLLPGAEEIVAAALAPHARELLYARVDLVPDAGGRPVVMELELTEPSLFFAHAPQALERFVQAIARHAAVDKR